MQVGPRETNAVPALSARSGEPQPAAPPWLPPFGRVRFWARYRSPHPGWFVEGYPFDTLGTKHMLYLAGSALVWVAVVFIGVKRLTPRQRRWVVVGLAVFSLAQELADDLLRAYYGVWTLQTALPLHLCSLGMLVSVWALLSGKQLVFEVAYYWVFAASTQAMLTPDNSRWQLGELDVFWNFLSHGVVILNVLWLVLVEGRRCRRWSWWRVFLITNLVTVPIALINLVLGSNYFFICRKPGGVSPFLIGDWPWYVLWFEAFSFLFFLVLYLPMGWMNRRRRRPVISRSGVSLPPTSRRGRRRGPPPDAGSCRPAR